MDWQSLAFSNNSGIRSVEGLNWAYQFIISKSLYEKSLDVRVPLTITTIYFVSALFLSAYNRKQGNVEWSINRSKAFFCLVAGHNVFLALKSALMFTMYASVVVRVFRTAWITGNSDNRLTRTLDVLCHIDPEQRTYLSYLPHTMIPPEYYSLWRDSLEIYGWLFYCGKIYELMDTFILLCQGKSPSILQVYHHTGAVLCVWAGARYMATPLWSFIYMNSGIHALMYSYYSLSLFKIRVPKAAKMVLTTMQILQILIAISYGTLSILVTYNVDPFQLYTRREVHIDKKNTIVACANTKGEKFAIILNVAYLVPLLGLFLDFFRKSYAGRKLGALKGKVKDL